MKKQISYICDSIAEGWMFTSGFTFNPRYKATNIGYLLFLGAVFGCRSKARINVGRFRDGTEEENGVLIFKRLKD